MQLSGVGASFCYWYRTLRRIFHPADHAPRFAWFQMNKISSRLQEIRSINEESNSKLRKAKLLCCCCTCLRFHRITSSPKSLPEILPCMYFVVENWEAGATLKLVVAFGTHARKYCYSTWRLLGGSFGNMQKLGQLHLLHPPISETWSKTHVENVDLIFVYCGPSQEMRLFLLTARFWSISNPEYAGAEVKKIMSTTEGLSQPWFRVMVFICYLPFIHSLPSLFLPQISIHSNCIELLGSSSLPTIQHLKSSTWSLFPSCWASSLCFHSLKHSEVISKSSTSLSKHHFKLHQTLPWTVMSAVSDQNDAVKKDRQHTWTQATESWLTR